MNIQQRALLAIADLDISVLKQLVASEEQLLSLLAWSDPHDGERVLHVIARAGNTDAAKLLLAQSPLSETHGTNPRRSAFLNAANSMLETPLHTALSMSSFATANVILQAGADPWLQNYNRETAFFMACYTGAIDFVTRTLQMKSCSLALVRSPSSDGLSPVDVATARGHKPIVDALQSYIASEKTSDKKDKEKGEKEKEKDKASA